MTERTCHSDLRRGDDDGIIRGLLRGRITVCAEGLRGTSAFKKVQILQVRRLAVDRTDPLRPVRYPDHEQYRAVSSHMDGMDVQAETKTDVPAWLRLAHSPAHLKTKHHVTPPAASDPPPFPRSLWKKGLGLTRPRYRSASLPQARPPFPQTPSCQSESGFNPQLTGASRSHASDNIHSDPPAQGTALNACEKAANHCCRRPDASLFRGATVVKRRPLSSPRKGRAESRCAPLASGPRCISESHLSLAAIPRGDKAPPPQGSRSVGGSTCTAPR
ncbi:hypothetical protein AAFF_G00040030 [Aldrovandia affinis]|uniref:Uncharacterized protein n=1 Tax=Aldrovandia affinis TaxID=143900 RepID=A0AAD7WFF6_9TELE|nr:hypothetical protein AAFF_G00040030 [Aldrovandia affinis]